MTEGRGGGRRLFKNLAVAKENAKSGGARSVPEKLVVEVERESRTEAKREYPRVRRLWAARLAEEGDAGGKAAAAAAV